MTAEKVPFPPPRVSTALAAALRALGGRAIEGGDVEAAREYASSEFRALQSVLAQSPSRMLERTTRQRIAELRIAAGDVERGLAEWDPTMPYDVRSMRMLDAARRAAALGEPRGAAIAAIEVVRGYPRSKNLDGDVVGAHGLLRQLARDEPLVVKELVEEAVDGADGIRQEVRQELKTHGIEALRKPGGLFEDDPGQAVALMRRAQGVLRDVQAEVATSLGDEQAAQLARETRDAVLTNLVPGRPAMAGEVDVLHFVDAVHSDLRNVSDPDSARDYVWSRFPPAAGPEGATRAASRLAGTLMAAAMADPLTLEEGIAEAVRIREEQEGGMSARHPEQPGADNMFASAVRSVAGDMWSEVELNALALVLPVAARENVDRLVVEGEALISRLAVENVDSVRLWAAGLAQVDWTEDGGYGEAASRAVLRAYRTTTAGTGATERTLDRDVHELFEHVLGDVIERQGADRAIAAIGEIEDEDRMHGLDRAGEWSAIRADACALALGRPESLTEQERDSLRQQVVAGYLQAARSTGPTVSKVARRAQDRLVAMAEDPLVKREALRAVQQEVDDLPGLTDDLPASERDSALMLAMRSVALFDRLAGPLPDEDASARSLHDALRVRAEDFVARSPSEDASSPFAHVLFAQGLRGDALELARSAVSRAELGSPLRSAAEQRLQALEAAAAVAEGDTGAIDVVVGAAAAPTVASEPAPLLGDMQAAARAGDQRRVEGLMATAIERLEAYAEDRAVERTAIEELVAAAASAPPTKLLTGALVSALEGDGGRAADVLAALSPPDGVDVVPLFPERPELDVAALLDLAAAEDVLVVSHETADPAGLDQEVEASRTVELVPDHAVTSFDQETDVPEPGSAEVDQPDGTEIEGDGLGDFPSL